MFTTNIGKFKAIFQCYIFLVLLLYVWYLLLYVIGLLLDLMYKPVFNKQHNLVILLLVII